MRYFFIALLALAGSCQSFAAGPKAGLDSLEFAGAHDQNTPVLLSAASRPIPFRGADGRVHIDYELQVINARAVPIKLVSLEVLDAASGKVLATVSGAEVAATFSILGGAAGDSVDAAQAGFLDRCGAGPWPGHSESPVASCGDFRAGGQAHRRRQTLQ